MNCDSPKVFKAEQNKYHSYNIKRKIIYSPACTIYKDGDPQNKENGSHYWLRDTHFAVSFGVEIDDIVAPMVVSAVYQHSMQDVVGWVLHIRFLQELIQW